VGQNHGHIVCAAGGKRKIDEVLTGNLRGFCFALSFTPGFSPVEKHSTLLRTVSTVSFAKRRKPFKRFSAVVSV
jgi:hypothetical protein